ncbi:MAG: hypothetical protein WBA73_14835 [Devosia sp.]
MPVYYRHRALDAQTGVIAVRIFALPQGISCLVGWPLPEPGLRVFLPTAEKPEMQAEALPYAQFLGETTGLRVTVELDPGMEWQPVWGELRDWMDG